MLTHRGLAAAVGTLADRAFVPVEVDIADERYPKSVESTAYFVTAEALTNVVKYSHASAARVSAARTGSQLVLTIEDDGVGGAEAVVGSGLTGLQDRVLAAGGTFRVDSPAGAGTTLVAELPCAS